MQRSEFSEGQPPEIPKPKESKEPSMASFVHEALAHEWKQLKFNALMYEDVVQMFENIRGVCEDKFVKLVLDKEERAAKLREIAEILLTDFTRMLPARVNADLFDVVADIFPEVKEDVAVFALSNLPETSEFAKCRFRFIQGLYRGDRIKFVKIFSELSSLERLEAVRLASSMDREPVFVWYEKMGMEPDDATVAQIIEDDPKTIVGYATVHKLTSNQVRSMLEQFDSFTQDSARRALQIPFRFISHEKEVSREFAIDVERMKDLSNKLADAMIRAYPERAEYLRAKKEKEAVLFGSIERYGELSSGMNSPLFVYLKDKDHTPAVYKPQKREAKGLRENIPAGSYAAREWLAYQIDQALQIGTTPVTILREGVLGVGSVQEWKVGRNAFRGDYKNKPNPEQLEDLVFDDVVKQNTDRHGQNVIIGFDGSVNGIDHGLIYTEDEQYWIICSPGYEFRGKEPSERVQNRIKQFRAAEEVGTILRECFDAALGRAAKRAWGKFEYGTEFLSPTYPEHSPRFPLTIQRASLSQREHELRSAGKK